MKRTIFKGQHMSWFPWPKRLKGKSHTFIITIEDPEMWEYVFRHRLWNEYFFKGINIKPRKEHYSDNQWDWNKLIGIKKNLFSPRKNSVMLGWRWNPIDNCLELCPYWHDENGGAHFDYEPLQIPKTELYKDNSLEVRFDYTFSKKVPFVRVRHHKSNHWKSWHLPNNAYIGTGWMISPWFGGQEKAQRKMVFNIAYSK